MILVQPSIFQVTIHLQKINYQHTFEGHSEEQQKHKDLHNAWLERKNKWMQDQQQTKKEQKEENKKKKEEDKMQQQQTKDKVAANKLSKQDWRISNDESNSMYFIII